MAQLFTELDTLTLLVECPLTLIVVQM